ncbi:MAG: MFS transporter [Coriobacteriales bacterium]|jgi:MFS family permease|nr:MFS transporter [Coriobacteriales bacterium]
MTEAATKNGLDKLSPKRWIAVLCMGLMHAICMGSAVLPGAYSGIIIGEWGVAPTSFVQLTMCSFLAGAIMSIPGGILADKFGVTKVLGIGMVIAFLSSVCRIFATQAASFPLVFVFSFLIGTGLAGMNANSVKFLQPWFKHTMSTGMTLYVSGAGIGVVGLMFVAGTFFPTDQVMMYIVAAAIFAVACVVWFAFARMPKDYVAIKDDYSLAAVKTVCTNKILILVSIAMVLTMASSASYAGNVPVVFIGKGVDPADAAVWASILNIVGMPSNWLAGPIADKLQRIKPVFIFMAVVGSAIVIVGWVLPLGAYTLPILMVGAFISWGNIGLVKGSVGLIPTLPKQYLGTAGGIQTFFQNLGAYLIPSYLFTPLSVGADGSTVTEMFFVLCGVFVILSAVVFAFVPELGLKGKIHQQLKQD